MLLAIDIGNTNVTLGVFTNEELRATWRMATDINRMPDEYAIFLLDFLRHQGMDAPDINAITMCSTVPPLTAPFQ